MDEPKDGQVTRFVADVEYQEIIEELRRRMGARSRSEVIRRALHEAHARGAVTPAPGLAKAGA